MLQAGCRAGLPQHSWQHTRSTQCCSNVQFVPHIECGASSYAWRKPLQLLCGSKQWQWQQRSRATVCTAAAPTAAPLPIEDPDPTTARLHALYRFVMDNGRVPKIHEQQEGVAVGHWAEQCKQQHQEQQLDRDLAAALESIDGWDWTPQVPTLSVEFEQGLQLLQQYQQSHGKLPRLRPNKNSNASSLEAQATAVCRQVGSATK